MAAETVAKEPDSIAEILSRAFDATATLPPAAAEMILNARFPSADLERVDELLERKRDAQLTPEQEALLRDYLHADSLLTILKSKARRSLKGAHSR